MTITVILVIVMMIAVTLRMAMMMLKVGDGQNMMRHVSVTPLGWLGFLDQLPPLDLASGVALKRFIAIGTAGFKHEYNLQVALIQKDLFLAF